MARTRKGKEIDCDRESKKKKTDGNKDVDPQLWHAFAGGIVQIPKVNSNIFYFPQGHAEHAYEPVRFPADIKIPSRISSGRILCRVAAIHYRADPDTDEVYAKIRLIPLDSFDDDAVGGIDDMSETMNKYLFYTKRLTVSDARYGSGALCIHKNYAETIFPPLDYSDNPNSQVIYPTDVHGVTWEFKHVCRDGKHHLGTGWSEFLTKKKLVCGDSLVFARAENGHLHIGIRRYKRANGFGFNPSSKSEIGTSVVPSHGELTSSAGEKDYQLQKNDKGNELRISDKVMGIGKVKAEDVIEAVKHCVNMQPFDVVYYPGVGTPEFFVETSLIITTLQTHWCDRMRFKMAIETEDSSSINWFIGTIASVQAADPAWPGSIWRLLQVTWDIPDLITKRVNPWQIEILPDNSGMQGSMHAHFSPSKSNFHLKNIPFNNDAITSTTVPNNPALQNKSTSKNDLCSIPIPTQSSEKLDCAKPNQIVLFGQTIQIDSGNENAENQIVLFGQTIQINSGNENAEKKITSSSSDPLQDLPKRSSGERLECNPESQCKKDTLAEETDVELED